MNGTKIYNRLMIWGLTLINYYHFCIEIIEDFKNNRQTSLGQKIWAYRRGFRSAKITMYGLNEQNYRQYMSDLDFHRLGSANGRYRRWIDDKLTMKYVLHSFNQWLPAYYYLLGQDKNPVISKLPDCPCGYGSETDDIIELLENKGCLAVKLLAGSLGVGFYKLNYYDGTFCVNEEPIDRLGLTNLLVGLRSYIITEYMTSHPALSSICGNRPNSVRVMTVRQYGTDPYIVGALMRFATHESGMVDNISAGGVVALVDLETGHFHNGRQLDGDEWRECFAHPDTGIPLEGTLPFWQEIKKVVLAVGNYLPLLSWMGFDIMIEEDGFKIIEINSQAGIALHNFYQPLYTEKECENLFKRALSTDQLASGGRQR